MNHAPTTSGRRPPKRRQKSFIRQLQEVGKEKPQFRELMQFYQELLDICAQNPPTFSVEAKFLRDKIRADQRAAVPPLLRVHELTLKQEAAENLFHRLLLWLSGRPRTSVDAQNIEAWWRKGNLSKAELFRNALKRDESYFQKIAQPLNLNRQLLFFLAFNSVRPAVESLADSIRRKPRQNKGGSCPVCGSAPAMAELRGEEGVRHFYCSFCGSEWAGERLICPYCQNQNQDSLRYFNVEGETGCSVYVCELCKKYIKTRNCREVSAQRSLFLEDLVTPHLDMLAARQGYQRGAHNIFALQIA